MTLEQQIKQEIDTERSINNLKSRSERRAKNLIHKWKQELFPSSKETITEEMIDRAREYDITLLFPEHKNNMVRCLFHDDNRASASIRKGFFRCFACGKSADTIEIYRTQTGCSFVEAVKALQ